MPLITDKNNNHGLFVHIPKAGGSSVEVQLKSLGFKLRLIENGISIKNNFPFKRTPQHYTYNLYEQILFLDKILIKVAIVRHPFDRFVSEFLWLCKNEIVSEQEEFIDNFLHFGLTSRFNIDGHLTPQHFFVGGDIKVFKLEENGVERCINAIQSHLNRSIINIPNFTRKKKKLANPSLKNLSERKFQPYAKEIEEFYSEDMKLFNYEPKAF